MTEPVSDEEEDYMDDLPFESHKVKPVKAFKDYTKSLNETVGIIEISCQDKCIQYCLDRIKEEVGSYNADEIFNVAIQTVDPRVKARIVLLHVKDMVIDYLSSEKAELAVVNTNGKKGKDIPKEALGKGLDVLYQDIADEVLVKIAEINGLSVSDGEDVWEILCGGAKDHKPFYFVYNGIVEAVRDGKWKCVAPHSYRIVETPGKDGLPGVQIAGGGWTELALYDMEADPCESRDLSGEYPEIAAGMSKMIQDFQVEINKALK